MPEPGSVRNTATSCRCCAVPLEGEQVVDAVAHRAGQHHQSGGERETAAGENRLPRPALDVAQRHPERGAEEVREPDALEQRGFEIRGRLRPHRLGGRQFHRLPDDCEHAQHRGSEADDQRQPERAVVHGENQRGKAEEHRVHVHQPRA